MKYGFARLAAAAVLVAVVALLAGTSTAPGGGVPDGTLIGLMDEVTNERNAPYTSTFVHTGKSQAHVRFHNPIPENEDGDQATFVDASCDGTLTSTEFVCDPIKLKKGQTATVTIVWETFAEGTSAGCDDDPCMQNAGFWTSDAGTNAPQKPNKSTPVGPVDTALLAGDDPEKAANYALAACDPEDLETATVATFPELDANNPLATIVCIPGFTPSDPQQPGLVSNVVEREVDENDPEGAVGQASEVCVAVSDCESPFQFEDRITLSFLIDEETFFPGNEIEPPLSPVTQVFHDGDPVLSCDDEETPDADPCVESITSDGTTSTVIATGTDNGDWDFG